MTIIHEPHVEFREEVPTLEVQVATPMKGLFQESDKLWKELSRWLVAHNVREVGPYYLRFRVIDMAAIMLIAVGVPAAPHPGDSRVVPSRLPRGHYASLSYTGHGLPANKKLLDWIRENNLIMDRWDDPRGDAFACRCETFLTDRRQEPLKKKWTIELSIKLTGPAAGGA